MYIPKNKTKRWSIQEKNEIVLLYLDQHMGRAQIMREFNIPTSSMLQRWIKQYQIFFNTKNRMYILTKKFREKQYSRSCKKFHNILQYRKITRKNTRACSY